MVLQSSGTFFHWRSCGKGQALGFLCQSKLGNAGADLIDRQAIIVQIAALLVQGMPGLMYGASQALCEVIVLEPGRHSDICRMGTCESNKH